MARQMKDSGVEWIGEIPEEWKVERTKYFYSTHKNIAGSESSAYERLALTMKGVVKRSKIDNTGLQPDNFDTYQILYEGELVFKLIDLQNISTSRVGLSPYTGLVSPAYIILKPHKNVVPEFGQYYFLSMWHREIFNHLGDDGVRSSLNSHDLLGVPYPILCCYEQRRIADYLDAKCAEIDKVVEKTRETIEEYKKLKQSIITETVTKGLNPDAEMKDSGIPWIGKIPVEWKFTRIGSLYGLRVEKVSDLDFQPLSVTKLGIVPQLETTAKTNAHDDRKLVKVGDFVINSRSDRRGSCGISKYEGSVSLINTILYPIAEMNPQYYNWLFHTKEFADEFYRWGHGIVDDLWTTGWQDMKNIVIVQPSLSEQRRIADYLDAKCAELDNIIEKKEQLIEELGSYKKSLIYEYVTGKKEVQA